VIFTRIEPLQHETFYVLSGEDASLDPISNNPVCFSPVSYRREIVDPGDIPLHAKIVVIGDGGRIRRVNLEAALEIGSGKQPDAVNEISAAVDTLKAAMQRNGLSAPISIELQDSDQAVKLASLFGDKLTPKSFTRVITSIFRSKSDFMIRGIRFTWKNRQDHRRSHAIKQGWLQG
jgi:hypothetical protein